MFSNSRKRVVWLSMFCLTFVFAQTALAGGDEKWREVTSAELQMKTPKVEADADAEAIFWEVSVADSYHQRAGFKSVLNHYIRVKIFTERGREKFSKVDIPFGKISDWDINMSVMDIAARTIKPDGTIIELKAADIFERDIEKATGVKLKAKSFAFPGIETGAIVEYRWKETQTDSVSYYVRLHLAREIPVQSVTYSIRPITEKGFESPMRIHSFNVDNHFEKTDGGFYSMTMKNVKAFHEEPRMPSEYNVRPWILVYYATDDNVPIEKYWKQTGKNVFDYHKTLLKPTDEIRKAATQAVGDATDTDEKIRRIFDFCRRNIQNIDDDASGLTGEQRQNFKANLKTSDTLKKRIGNWHDISMLFGAMLIASGFDARVANVAVRSDANFDKGIPNDHFIRTENIAVKVGDEWKFYDPATIYIPFGMLFWSEEGQPILISDADEPVWTTTPKSSPEKSMQKRIARLRLNEDGSITGNVRVEYTGHLAEFYKEFNDDDSPAEREKTLIAKVKEDISSTAELTEILVENVQDPDKPFVYSFNINLPAYGERTGKRLFVRPNIFERNTNALFRTSARKYDLSFQYPWSEEDDIVIEFPAGYSIESAEAPRAIKDEKGIGTHETRISLSDDKRMLTYHRKLAFGNNANLTFPKSNYSFLKQLFELFHTADAHSISLKQG